MKRDKDFSNILDECLQRLLAEDETVERCLERYPEHATELEPLLKMAVATSKALVVQPDAEFKARARYQLRSLFEKVQPKKRAPFLIWQPRWALAIVILLVVVVAGGGTVVAADSDRTVPGNPLYQVKLATEQVRLKLTRSDVDKAELYATLVDRRVAEISRMVDRGRPRMVELAASRLRTHLEEMNGLSLGRKSAVRAEDRPARMERGQIAKGGEAVRAPANAKARLKVVLGRCAANHPAKLRSLMERAPEEVKPALRQAIAVSTASYKKALEDLD